MGSPSSSARRIRQFNSIRSDATTGIRENYVAGAFTLGHSEPSTGGGTDKNVSLNLATTKAAFSNIAVVLDDQGDPYGVDDYGAFTPGVDGGTYRDGGPTSESARSHLDLNPASAQSGGNLLTTYLLHAGVIAPSTSTNVLLPINADEIWVNGASVATRTACSRSTRPNPSTM